MNSKEALLTKLRLQFDEIIGYNNREFNDILWAWVKRNSTEISNQVQAVVLQKIAFDSGLPKYDELAKLWNEGKLTPTELASKMWNGGYAAGCEDTEKLN